MKSYDVIRKAVDEPGVKAIAARLKVSAALVYKWCEPPDTEDKDQSGVRNPLDRVRELYRMTEDIQLIQWLCHEAGGFYVTNPDKSKLKPTLDESIFGETRGMVRDFSELLDAITNAHEDDPGIDAVEADLIRVKWEDLKTCIESFVVGCEKGIYGPQGAKKDDKVKG